MVIRRKRTWKKKLTLSLHDDTATMTAVVASSYTIQELVLVGRENERDTLRFSPLRSKKGTYVFQLHARDIPVQVEDEARIFDLYFLATGPDGTEGMHRVGGFSSTTLPSFETIFSGYFYPTKKGNLSFSLGDRVHPCVSVKTLSFRAKKNGFRVCGFLLAPSAALVSSTLLLKERACGKFQHQGMKLKRIRKGNTRNIYYFSTFIPLTKEEREDIYDVYVETRVGDQEPVITRINKPFLPFRKKSVGSVLSPKQVLVATPYLTIKGNVSIQADILERDSFTYLKRIEKIAPFLRPFWKKRDIWLIGEKPYKAQDNGYHLFSYIRKNHPDQEAYYVIEEDSPERKNLEPLGNVLLYRSKKHMLYTLMATRIIGTHHPDDLYPLKTASFARRVQAKKMFLQHGVMGTKNTVHLYGAHSPGFTTDLFFVSSELEKNIIHDDFHYTNDQIKVTGLSRFDALLNGDTPTKKQLLIIPTWREWLLNDDDFEGSDYFQRYRSLVTHPDLHRFAKEHGVDIIFCLHPNMQKYTEHFRDVPVRVISQGEVDVQTLLKESAMMITDYSSVAFDFSFLHKPVLYYQFDQKRFIGKKGSHLSLEEDLPGEIVTEEEELLDLIQLYTQQDFQMKEKYQARSNRFLTYRDTGASERIFQEIKQAHKAPKHKGNPLRLLGRAFRENRVVSYLYRRYRKSRFYFPHMKVLFALYKRLLPVDKTLIVFESGIGKQYSDSPKAIYEELVRRQLPYRYVWVSNQKRRFQDPNTITVKRLSPQYYYYLARARFWVNNQNFPTYLKKRKKTTYLQTWHGTPLKRMLFDIEEVQGRSDDYVERVYAASKTWDYLLSPSAYASHCFRSAFRYEGKILELGYPRNDVFYRDDQDRLARRVRESLRIPKEKKVVLYAPTFRDNVTNRTNGFLFDLQLDIQRMKEALGDEYVLLLRTHVVIKGKVKIDPSLRDFVRDVSGYDDIGELFVASDVLITDYSSVFFDFANTKRPIIFFTYDLQTYKDSIRGFYMELEEEAPGPVVGTTDEVIHALQHIQAIHDSYQEKYEAFYGTYCGLDDGKASKRVVDHVFL